MTRKRRGRIAHHTSSLALARRRVQALEAAGARVQIHGVRAVCEFHAADLRAPRAFRSALRHTPLRERRVTVLQKLLP